MRAELNVPWSANLIPHVIGGDEVMLERLAKNAATLSRMAKIGPAVTVDSVPQGSAQIVCSDVTLAFPLEGAIDIGAERARLSRAVTAAEKGARQPRGAPRQPGFSPSAPSPEAVEKARADHDARAAEAERLSAALARLG